MKPKLTIEFDTESEALAWMVRQPEGSVPNLLLGPTLAEMLLEEIVVASGVPRTLAQLAESGAPQETETYAQFVLREQPRVLVSVELLLKAHDVLCGRLS